MNNSTESPITLTRWRLILGRFAQEALGASIPGDSSYFKMDQVLDYLYGREYADRNVRPDSESRSGDLSPTALTIPEWLRQARDLFPRETTEIIQRHALQRYDMKELVTDPEVLQQMEPSYDLLKTMLTFKGMMQPTVLALARKLIRQIVEELREKLAREVRQAFWGRLNRNHRTRLKAYRNLDIRRTIRANLKNYDPDRRQIVLGSLHFFSRIRNHMPWHIIMAVDSSGSMIDSVIYSAVMAGIFRGLPSLRVKLIAFDTSVVDLSDAIEDPTEVLMSVQLGGGTNIGGALQYCESLVVSPTRTIVVLVTDFYEGGPPGQMLRSIKRLKEGGAKVLGLAALDQEAAPAYDHEMAERCVEAGAEVAALTPRRLAEWLGQVLS